MSVAHVSKTPNQTQQQSPPRQVKVSSPQQRAAVLLSLGRSAGRERMVHLTRALDLAENRGYFRYPEVVALRESVPDWFRGLGTVEGIASFEARHGLTLPATLREFYGCLPLACFLEATGETEVFLRELAESECYTDFPPLVEWSSKPFVVVAFHGHSGCVLGVSLEGCDPTAVWGSETAQHEKTAIAFSEWIYTAVEDYERQLDDWQRLCEKCTADPAEAQRLGNAAWVRQKPGMAERLGRTIRRSSHRRE